MSIGVKHIKVKRLPKFHKRKQENSNDRHKFGYVYRYFQLPYLKYLNHVKEILALISVRYPITDLQTPETL